MEKEEKGEPGYGGDTFKWLLRPLLDPEAPILLRANCVRSLALLANQSEAQREQIARSKDAPNIAKASLNIMNTMESKMRRLHLLRNYTTGRAKLNAHAPASRIVKKKSSPEKCIFFWLVHFY